MFGLKFSTITKRDKKFRRNTQRDIIAEQVKKVLEDTDQKLILMVRG